MSQSLNRPAVQSLVLHGSHCTHGLHVLLRIDQRDDAQRFLGRARVLVSFGEPSLATQWLNIGLSYRGLVALGLPDRYLSALRARARAFCEGAVPRAALRLADTGGSAAEYWDHGFEPNQAHLLLSLHGDSQALLEDRLAELRGLDGAGGLGGWDRRHLTARLPDPSNSGRLHVHFGYRDGIAKLHVGDAPGQGDPTKPAAGEFVLGYANEAGYDRWQPLSEAERTGVNWTFFRDSSFAALRKIEQDEVAFRSYVSWASGQLSASRSYVMAKLCGRWPSGHLLRPGQQTAPDGEPESDFKFADDRRGEGCPFGAHIRRMNPRDDALAVTRHRTLLRRGMPYGPAYEDAGQGQPVERGLLGLFFCASLEDQFEHLLGEWADKNPLGPANAGTAKDPLIGQHTGTGGSFLIPQAQAPALSLGGLSRFTRTRGTAYLLYPGRQALAVLAGAPGDAH